MYRNSYQQCMLSVFYSVGSKPLAIWETHIQDGNITRFLDEDLKSMVLEIRGTNVSTTYMICPKGKQVLGIHMPFMVMIVKNLKKYFSFEVTILDDSKTRRRFRVSNFQSTSQVLPLFTVMPIGLNDGWNQIQFDLAKFTQRAYQRQLIEVQKVKINANIRLRRIYFAQRLVPDDELPAEYKLYFPLASKSTKVRKFIDNAKFSKVAEMMPPTVEEKRKGSITVMEKTASKMSQHSIRRPSQEKKPGESPIVRAEGAAVPAETLVEGQGLAKGAEGGIPVELTEGTVPVEGTEGVEGLAPEESKAPSLEEIKVPSATKIISSGVITQPEGTSAEGEIVEVPAEAEAAPDTIPTERVEVEAGLEGEVNPPAEDTPPQEEAPAKTAEVTEAPQSPPAGTTEPAPVETPEL